MNILSYIFFQLQDTITQIDMALGWDGDSGKDIKKKMLCFCPEEAR